MRKIWNKGHRIRASDKHLVYHFSIGTLLFVFVAVLLLLNSKQLMRTDWEHFSLLENGLTLCPYNFITILIATGVCALVAFGYYRFCYDSFKKLLHRQKLARMVLENKWYEADTVQDSGFFTDLQSRSREKIVWFPKIYYQMEKGLLHIRCEITLGKYQDQLLRLEDKLESGLYCELTDKTLHDGYIEYTLLYDMIANRITIDEVRAENGCLRLMKNLVWEYDALPHALIAGGTGGGKTYFLLTLIEALLHTNAVLYILDPKNSDLADLGTVMPNVYHTKEEMIDWFTFPIDEEDVKEKIGLNEQYEEYAIHDTDNFPIAIGEYVSIEELNEMYEMIEELPDYIVECLDEFISHYGTLEEVVEHKDDIYYYPDCETMTDVAYYYIDELQALGDIPPSLQNYIDYEAYGRDLDMGGCFIETSRGMCEIPY
ncbi:hypothetical protein EYA86_10890 [Mediterraneibacter sp. gm002]|nr:hypothetical protein D8Q48_10400 [Ruminococcus sp. B05]TAP32199.1 hypothetical protein EYA86_10890 [Mediterraneibacter sp. gm002]